MAREIDLNSLARAPFVCQYGVSSQPPSGIEATTTNHSDAFEKVKVAIARDNATPKVVMPILVDVVMQDSHGTSIVDKWKEKVIDSIYLHVPKPTAKSSKQLKSVMKTTAASKFTFIFCPNAFVVALAHTSLASKEIERRFALPIGSD